MKDCNITQNEAALVHFSILSTNIQSLNSKFSELEAYIEELDCINFKFNIICIQESWKAEGDDFSQFVLHGYNAITQGKSCSGKGGLVIYILIINIKQNHL